MITENISGYTIEAVCQMIARYILILKGVKVVVQPPQTQKQLNLFEQAANYAITAYEGGWKLKEQ